MTGIRRRCVSALLVLTVVAAIGAGVSAQTTLTFYALPGNAARQQAIMEFVVPRFEQLYPGVKVEVIWGQDSPDKLKTLIASGVDLDVVFVRLENFADMVKAGVYEPLDGFVEWLGFDLTNIPEIALESFTYEGELYGLPFDSLPFNVTTLYVNFDILNAAGLMIPPYDLEDPYSGWTYDEFRDILKKVTVDTDGDGVPNQYGFGGTYGWIGNAARLLWNHGADLLIETEDGWVPGVNSPEAIKALQWARDLRFVDGVVGGNWFNGTMFTRHGAMALIGTTMNNEVSFDWTVVPVPRGEAGRWNIAHVNPMGIYRGSKNKDLAFEFIKFWLSDEVQFYMVDRDALPPLTWNAARRPEYVFTPVPPYDKTPFFFGRSRALPVWAPGWEQIQGMITATFPQALNQNSEPIESLMLDLERRIQAFLDEVQG